jgi:hypothetical protein
MADADFYVSHKSQKTQKDWVKEYGVIENPYNIFVRLQICRN